MGFTQVSPESQSKPAKVLHCAPRFVGFTTIGPAANDTNEVLEPNPKSWANLQKWPQGEAPTLCCGDVVTVELTSTGQLRRYVNKKLIDDIDTGRLPLEDWYGAFEVSFRVARVCLVNDELYPPVVSKDPLGSAGVDSIDVAKKKLTDVLSAMQECLQDSQLSITIATQEEDSPLVFVTDGFESLTGYRRSDIIGKNCRFLNKAAEMPVEARAAIRQAIDTGRRFTGVIPNRRLDGTPFHNLLDLRSLEIGTDDSGAPVRLLIGIQGEVGPGRTAEHWSLELPGITLAVQRVIGSTILGETQFQPLVLGPKRFLKPHDWPFWVDEFFSEKLQGS